MLVLGLEGVNAETVMTRAECETQNRASEPPAVDLAAALVRLGGDEKLLEDLIGFFFEDAFKLLDDLHASVARCDWPAMRRAAHSLKGLASNFGAKPAVVALQLVEMHDGASEIEVAALVRDVDREISRLAAALTENRKVAANSSGSGPTARSDQTAR
jgi:HPt (histidine-containing phosphotransfer) domain-containing protein